MGRPEERSAAELAAQVRQLLREKEQLRTELSRATAAAEAYERLIQQSREALDRVVRERDGALEKAENFEQLYREFVRTDARLPMPNHIARPLGTLIADLIDPGEVVRLHRPGEFIVLEVSLLFRRCSWKQVPELPYEDSRRPVIMRGCSRLSSAGCVPLIVLIKTKSRDRMAVFDAGPVQAQEHGRGA